MLHLYIYFIVGMNTHIQNSIIWGFLAIAVLIVMFLIWLTPNYISIAHLVQDSVTHSMQFSSNTHKNNIIILKIDDATLDAQRRSDLGMLTIDKWFYAEVIEKLFEDYQVGTIGFDVVFANPSVVWEQDDIKLQKVLQKYQDRIVIATRADMNPYPLCLYSWVPHGAIDKSNQEVVRSFSIEFDQYQLDTYCEDYIIHEANIWSIESLPYRLFQISIPYLSALKYQEFHSYLSLFKELWWGYISYFSNSEDNNQTFWFQSYSLIDIYNWKELDLRNKIILIWEVGTLIHDSHITPVNRSIAMPWVEINAHIIETLHQGRVLHHLWVWYLILIFLGIAIYLCYIILYHRFTVSIFWYISVIVWVMIFSMRAFSNHHMLVPFFTLLVWTSLYFFALHLYKYLIVEKAGRNLKKQFSLYVAPEVVEDISNNPHSVILEWEEKDMTILFSDIVNFTSISESTEPKRLLRVLNEYFKEMTAIIHRNKGTLDKYIWDAIMCFYWAPLNLEHHSYYACKTALEQQAKLRELRKKWSIENLPDISMRIGIHSWNAIHWNIWSSDTRVNYTIIGDNVNLASRLEGLCKEYGVSICVSQEVFAREKENFYMRELDILRVKGKQQAVGIYELIASKQVQLSRDDINKYKVYIDALKLYRAWDYTTAKNLWDTNISDPASSAMSKRCSHLLNGQAHLEEGVYQMDHK